MNISSIKYVPKSSDAAVHWRCKNGVGIFRNCVVLGGKSADVQNIARAIVFALAGRRSQNIEEVTLELTDNAGDTWEIWRGLNSSRFSHNGRIIPIDEAQRSMLAALLDMDPGISHGNGLVSPVLFRVLACKNSSFTSLDALNGSPASSNEPDPETIIQVLMDECVRLTGRKDFANAEAIATLATGLMTLKAKWSEIQASAGSKPAGGELAPSIGLIESITRELDHLQQIDYLCRRMTDVHESIPRLTAHIESIDQQILSINSKWSKQALASGLNSEEWNRGMECLIRVRAYGRLAETAAKLQKLSAKRLKPAAEKSMDQWHQFLFNSRTTGQEVESCLASMLLGMKQLGLDLEAIDQQIDRSESTQIRDGSRGWFERFKGRGETPQNRQSYGIQDQHGNWLQKSVRDIEAVKASIEYALKSVQSFSDEFESAKAETSKELALLDDLSQKALDELTKLKDIWVAWSQAAAINIEISLEDFVGLAKDAHELQILELQRLDLQTRLAERIDVQTHLEAQVRQWWSMIGSDKEVDISNPAFLVAEAKAALRHRDTRRQRVHKLIKEAARSARDESLAQWNYKRRTEIVAQWNDAFTSLGLPVIEMNDERVESLVRLGSAVFAMKQLQVVREQSVVARNDVWGQKDEFPVRLFLWDQPTDDVGRNVFVDMVSKFPTGKETAITFLLVTDDEIVKRLTTMGCGRGILAQVDHQRLQGRAGAEKLSRKDYVADQTPVSPNSQTAIQPSKITKGSKSHSAPPKSEAEMSDRAAAALKLLNPKSTRT